MRAGAENRPKGVARLDVAVEHVGGQAGVDEGRGHGARESEYRLGTGGEPQFSRLLKEDHWAEVSGAVCGNCTKPGVYDKDINAVNNVCRER